MSVCTTPDEFIHELEFDRGMALWRARLSNGEIVIQDDYRPGLAENSAWIRLAAYCEENRLKIEQFWLEFRGNKVCPLKENAEGYFFRKGILAEWSEPENAIGVYLMGDLTGEEVRVEKWWVPPLEYICEEVRPASDSGPSLIRNV